jgi:succinyl-diaminopimelate desuccinylase
MFDNALLGLKDELIQALCTNLRIPSDAQPPEPGKPNGPGVAKALEHALRVANQLGFQTKNLDGHAGYAQYGSGDEMIAVLGHLDVVPAGEGWTHPPYAGIIDNDKIYGRGTVDDKGPMFAALFALKAIKDSGLPLSRRVRIIFGTSEETGSADMDYYRVHEELPVAGFTPDAEFPVIHAEKGLLNVWFYKEFIKTENAAVSLNRLNAGNALNMVPDQATAELKLNGEIIKVNTIGASAHASRPEDGKNAIGPLLDFLSHQDLPLEMQDACSFLAYSLGQETAGENLGIAMKDEVSGALTVNLGLLEGDMDKIRGGLNIRYPVTISKDQVLGRLEKGLAKGGFEIESFTHTLPLHVEKDHQLVKVLMDVFNKKTGLSLSPITTGGGTYARSLPNTLAFGPQFPEQANLCHQADEYIEISYLIKTAQIIATAMYELAK